MFGVLIILFMGLGTLSVRMGRHESQDTEVQRRLGDLETGVESLKETVKGNTSLLGRIAAKLGIE